MTDTNVESFIANNVFGLIGPVGIGASLSTAALASSSQIPLLGPLSGSVELTTSHYVISIFYFPDAITYSFTPIDTRASEADESAIIVDFLVNNKSLTKIAAFYDPEFVGTGGGYQKLVSSLHEHKLELIGEITTNTAVGDSVDAMRKWAPEGVILYTNSQVRGLKRDQNLRYLQVLFNFMSLALQLLGKSTVYIAYVVSDPSWPQTWSDMTKQIPYAQVRSSILFVLYLRHCRCIKRW